MTPPSDQQSVERLVKGWLERAQHSRKTAVNDRQRSDFSSQAANNAAADIYESCAYDITRALTAHDEALPGEWTVDVRSGTPTCRILSGTNVIADNISTFDGLKICEAHNETKKQG